MAPGVASLPPRPLVNGVCWDQAQPTCYELRPYLQCGRLEPALLLTYEPHP
ncbi:MAG: hypothetical protein ACF8TS_16020 [Maioricimonas sp. JB049]